MMSVVIAISRRGVLHPLDPSHVVVARIEPLHAVEHLRRTRLNGQMDMIAESRIAGRWRQRSLSQSRADAR